MLVITIRVDVIWVVIVNVYVQLLVRTPKHVVHMASILSGDLKSFVVSLNDGV